MPDQPAPQNVEEFHQRLRAMTDALPKRLRQCAEYLAAHADRIALSTVAELAQAAGVQPSALMRFCQIMGFSGFSEMQRLFRESYAQVWPDYATRLRNLSAQGPESSTTLLAGFIDASRISLEKLAKTAEPDRLEAAVATLGAAGVEVAQQVLAETQTAILPLVPYLDTLRWVFIAVALGGIAVTIYARLDDWRRGQR